MIRAKVQTNERKAVGHEKLNIAIRGPGFCDDPVPLFLVDSVNFVWYTEIVNPKGVPTDELQNWQA